MQIKLIPRFLKIPLMFSKIFFIFLFVLTLFSIVSISSGSEAANKIASTCLSNLEGEEGKLIILFFFFYLSY